MRRLPEALEDKADAAVVAEFHEAYRAGISKPYLSQIESGKRQGTVETLAAIARALGIPLEVLAE